MSQTAWIIGVGPGLGLALAKRFHKAGFRVLAVARNLEKLDALVADLAEGGNAHTYSADVGEEQPLRETLGAMINDHGTPTVVIYNVSVLRPSPPSELEYRSFIQDFHTNVGGALTAFQEVLPGFRERGGGTFAITGGGLALRPYYEFASLAVGKAAVRNLAFSMHQEVRGSGIHVFTITVNGMIEEGTPFSPERIADKYFEVFEEGLPEGETEYVYEGSAASES